MSMSELVSAHLHLSVVQCCKDFSLKMMLALDEQLDPSASLEFLLSPHLGTTSCPVSSSLHRHRDSHLEGAIVEDVCSRLVQDHLHEPRFPVKLDLLSMSDLDTSFLTD